MKNQKNKKKSKLTEEKGSKKELKKQNSQRFHTERNPTEMQNNKSSYIHREPVMKKKMPCRALQDKEHPQMPVSWFCTGRLLDMESVLRSGFFP